MPRTKKSRFPLPLVLLLLAGLAVAVFVAGEALVLGRSDRARILLARHLRIGDPAQVTRLIGKQIRRGLEASGVVPDSIRESFRDDARVRVQWRVGLKPDASLLQTNAAIQRAIGEQGGAVMSGRESRGPDGEARVTLLVGLPGRPTHEVLLARSVRPLEETVAPGARLSIVLFGFGDDLEETRRFATLGVPFAMAIAPGGHETVAMFRAAREASREIVVHLPLEPIHYPQVNPGPNAILVTMEPNRITGTVRRWLEQSGGAIAVANLMGSLATQDEQVMTAIYRELSRRHVPFIHVERVPGALCQPLAARFGVAYDRPTAVIDTEARSGDTKALDRRWKEILADTRERRQAMVWVRATPLVRRWLPEALGERRLDGVALVPLTSVLRRPARL